MVANTDSDWAKSRITDYGNNEENLMKYACNFVFSYDGRAACAVYKVNHMVKISCTIDYSKFDVNFKGFTVKAIGFGSQYCNVNNDYMNSRDLYYVFNVTKTNPVPTFTVGTEAETVSFTVDMAGNALVYEKTVQTSKYDSYLGYLFTYTDSRNAGKPLKIEAVINTVTNE